MSNSLMGVVCGISIDMRFGFAPIENFSLGSAAHLASGPVFFKKWYDDHEWDERHHQYDDHCSNRFLRDFIDR